MEYIIVLEHNHKEDETYVFYCQWTGNEQEMEKLAKAIETADTEDLSGDYASFSVSRVKIPEAAVDTHCSISDFCGYIHMFQKCEGTFQCPDFSEDPYERAKELDDYYYHGKLREDFSETKETLRKRLESYFKK
jgi:hypothetical protein